MSTPPPTYPQAPLPYETPRPGWNAVSIGAVALKLMGIYCLILAAPIVNVPFYFFAGPPGATSFTLTQIVGSFLIYGIYLAFAIAFIFFANPLARWLFRGEPAELAAAPMPVGPYLQAVALSIAGVLILVDAAGSIAYYAFESGLRSSQSETYLIVAILKATLGVALILGGPGLAMIWHKMRTGGTIHEDRV